MDVGQLPHQVTRQMRRCSSSTNSPRLPSYQLQRRTPGRVEKPRSQHASPRSPSKKNHKRYSWLDEHYRRMMGLEEDDEDTSVAQDDDTLIEQDDACQQSQRPFSWHPSQGFLSDNFPQLAPTYQHSSPSGQSLPSDDAAIHPIHIQTERTWAPCLDRESVALAASESNSTSYNQLPIRSNHTRSNVTATGWICSEEALSQGDASRSTREESPELIGIGLYDQPGFTLKTFSKLEEACEVPEALQAADESSEEEEEEPPQAQAPQLPSFLSHDKSVPVCNFRQQSYFARDGDDLLPAWWMGMGSGKQHVQPAPLPFGCTANYI